MESDHIYDEIGNQPKEHNRQLNSGDKGNPVLNNNLKKTKISQNKASTMQSFGIASCTLPITFNSFS